MLDGELIQTSDRSVPSLERRQSRRRGGIVSAEGYNGGFCDVYRAGDRGV